MPRLLLAAFLLSLVSRPGLGQDLSPEVHQFVKVEASIVALTHLRVVDGTGSGVHEDQTIILRGGKIESVGNSAAIPLPPHVTGPYLEGSPPVYVEMHELRGPEDARKDVAYWADLGVTSFKAYMHITRAELAAAIDESHKRGLKITGHLCAVGYHEAAAMGIDNLEHGPIFADSEFDPSKRLDLCPPLASSYAGWARTDISSAPVQELIHDLVAHNVAITSTLPVFEQLVPGRPLLQQRSLDAMALESRVSYLTQRARGGSAALGLTVLWDQLLKKEMEFERAFVKAGGLLLAGPDPTGIGGVLPGFGDQREVELLVEAGFSPVEAIHIATSNGAQYLGQLDHFGTIAVGKQADLVVLKGDPTQKIEDIENVEIVFKDGIGYDSAKLIESVRAQVEIR